MFKLSRTIILISLSFILISCQIKGNMIQKKLQINNQILTVEVAQTVSQMAKGLSNRQSLAEDQGMLFDYADSEIRNFHMKNMNFPLDIIWLNKSQIIGVFEEVPIKDSAGQITKIQSPAPVDQVLEVNAGWASHHQVKIGEVIKTLD